MVCKQWLRQLELTLIVAKRGTVGCASTVIESPDAVSLISISLNSATLATPLGSVFSPRRSPPAPFLRGENLLKVPLFKGDLGGSPGLQTLPSHAL